MLVNPNDSTYPESALVYTTNDDQNHLEKYIK